MFEKLRWKHVTLTLEKDRMFLRNLLVLIEIDACDTKVHIVEETPIYCVNMDFKITIKGLGKAKIF